MSAFHDVRLPVNVSAGALGGPRRKTDVVTTGSGREERNARWADSRREWAIGYGIRSLDDLAAVVAFFEARRGRLHSFRFRDWADFKSCDPSGAPAATDQPTEPPTGDGTRTTFQLAKTYGAGSPAPYVRAITKPVAGTVLVALGGTAQASGWTLDARTGVLAFDVAPGDGVAVTWGGEFDVEARFAADALDVSVDALRAGTVPDVQVVEVRS